MNIAFLSSAFLREMKESTTITLVSLAKELLYRGHNVVVVIEAKEGYPADFISERRDAKLPTPPTQARF